MLRPVGSERPLVVFHRFHRTGLGLGDRVGAAVDACGLVLLKGKVGTSHKHRFAKEQKAAGENQEPLL